MGLKLPQLILDNASSEPIINLIGLPSASSLTNVIIYNSSSGQLSYTSSDAIGGGGSGDITSVTAGNGMSGGGASGDVTLTLDTGSTHFTAGVGKLAGGSDTQIQFNSGSAFSGSSNFTFNYINNTARVSGSLNITGSTILSSSLRVIGTTSLTGSLTVTGSTILSGSFDNTVSQNSDYVASIVNTNLTTAASAELLIRGGTGISGSSFYIQSTPKGYTSNTYYPGSVLMVATPTNFAGDVTRPMKLISMIAGTPAASAFEWHYSSSFTVDQFSLKMKLDVPSGTLSNSGSIVTSGSLIVASDSAYSSTTSHDAIYFGTPGAAGSWRIALSGSSLIIEKWPLVGSAYSRSATFT
jgi:hypothetical protein